VRTLIFDVSELIISSLGSTTLIVLSLKFRLTTRVYKHNIIGVQWNRVCYLYRERGSNKSAISE